MIKRIEKFGAAWCGPCKMLDRTLEQMSASGKLEGIEVIKYDVDKYEELAEEKKIRNVPVLIYYNENNEEINRTSGAVNAVKIQEIINS